MALTETASGKTSRSNRPAFFHPSERVSSAAKPSLVTLLHCGTFTTPSLEREARHLTASLATHEVTRRSRDFHVTETRLSGGIVCSTFLGSTYSSRLLNLIACV